MSPDEKPTRSKTDLAWTVFVALLWLVALVGVVWLIALTFFD